MTQDVLEYKKGIETAKVPYPIPGPDEIHSIEHNLLVSEEHSKSRLATGGKIPIFLFSALGILLEMLLFTMMLMVSVTFGETYPTGPLIFGAEGETPEETVFQVLQRLDLLPTSGPPLSKPSVYFPTDVANPPLSSGFPRSAWWWHPEILHPEMKKRHNLASYNLNSFGLRYGK
ncbi:hypothetical protein SRHO_G00270230 [Serrasalmus rhombeus]